ncbi:MAG: dihydroorotase family protein [Microbacterium pygmaeum]
MTDTYDLLIRGGTVVRPGIAPALADVAVIDGRIAALLEPGTTAEASEFVDATGLHVLPGSVDPHLHIGLGNGIDEYPGETGAVALGGVTTVFNILSQPGSYLPVLEEHVEKASATSRVDFGFHAVLMTEDHLIELDEITSRFGLTSFKYFMSFRGDEGKYLGVEGTHDGKMLRILEAVAARGDLLFVHAENLEVVWTLRDELMASGRTDLAAWDDSRPPFTEAEAVRRVTYFAQAVGARLYLVHISTADSLEQIRRARAEFPHLDLSVETCPHYLTHTVDYAGGVIGKVNPPLRRAEHVEAVWEGIADGTVTTIGSDHVSRKRSTKDGPIWTASAGFPDGPVSLPVLLTHGHLERGIPLERIVELSAAEPARLLGLARKGDIAPGFDADLAIVDLATRRTADPAWLGTNSDYSLYEDHELAGWSRHTFVRGTAVVRDGVVVAEPGTGSYVHNVDHEEN